MLLALRLLQLCVMMINFFMLLQLVLWLLLLLKMEQLLSSCCSLPCFEIRGGLTQRCSMRLASVAPCELCRHTPCLGLSAG